ncbi:MAG: GNAT family N-acetyltransferase [Nitrososphaerales archaeon]|jgi:GNAT superfamily N-acetyltransferase
MRIVSFDELPEEWEPRVQLLDASVGWFLTDFRRMKEARRTGYPAADYFGVYAVEGNEVQSAVRVLRIPYTLASGATETVSAIQGVVTRREWSRRGLAKALLREVHRREAAVGNKFSLLWMGFWNFSHALYRSIGYVDIYSPRLAMRRCDGPKSEGQKYKLRTVKKVDASTIEKLHAESTGGRVGFTPRPKSILSPLFKLGFVKPEAFRLILFDEEPVGYLQMQKGRGWVKSDEVVLTERADPGAVVSLLQREATPGWLLLQGTFVRDSSGLLGKLGYLSTDYAYYGLMAMPLEGVHKNLKRELGTASRSFTCHFLDYF